MGLRNPITAAGSGLQNIGKDLGGATTTAGGWLGDRAKDLGGAAAATDDWLGDRAKDVVRGDVLGFGRRENEDLRRNFEEKLSSSDSKLADLREHLGKGAVTGKIGDVDLAGASNAVHGGQPGTGALSKDLDASYKVTDGDSLSAIAQDKGKSVEDLLGLNPELGDGNLIRAGQEIKLDNFTALESPAEQVQALASSPTPAPEVGFERQV